MKVEAINTNFKKPENPWGCIHTSFFYKWLFNLYTTMEVVCSAAVYLPMWNLSTRLSNTLQTNGIRLFDHINIFTKRFSSYTNKWDSVLLAQYYVAKDKQDNIRTCYKEIVGFICDALNKLSNFEYIDTG